MLTALSVSVREGCMSSSCLTTTLPVASLCCGRPSGSVWWLHGSMVRQHQTVTIHTTQTAQFNASLQPPFVISFRRRPIHGRRGPYDRLSASALHEVVLVLHHTFCLCGECCSAGFSYMFYLPVANSWHFLVHIGSVPVPRGKLQAPDLQHSVHLPPVGWSAWLGISPVLHALYPSHRSLQATALQRIFAGGQYGTFSWACFCL